jgi:hypothetical protein
MNDQEQTRAELEQVEGDGGGEKNPTKELIDALNKDIDQIWTDASAGLFEQRKHAEETRFCIWDGQSPDGKKRKEVIGKEPFPFEGASDQRVRLADTVINERVAILVTAATRAAPGLFGMEINDTGLAARVKILMRFIIKSQWRCLYRTELTKLANYMEGDDPGIGVLYVYWYERRGLELTTVTLEELAGVISQLLQRKLEKQEITDLLDMLQNPEREDEAIALLRTMVKVIKSDGRAREMIREFRETGKATFPRMVTECRMPRLAALKLFEDVLFPSNTPTDLQRARAVYMVQTLTASEVREKEHSEGWSPEFIEEVLKRESEAAFPDYSLLDKVTSDYSLTNARSDTREKYRDRFQVITAFQRAVNDDGVPGVYMTTFHHLVTDETAKGRELLDYPHMGQPFVEFPREIITSRLWDSRGVAGLLMTQQASMKTHHDVVDDVAVIGGLPPIMTPHNRPKTPLVIRSLGQIPERRPGEYRWFQPPPPPQVSAAQIGEIRRQVNEYMGRMDPENPNDLAVVLRQMMVDQFLDRLATALTMAVQCAIHYLSRGELERITGKKWPSKPSASELRSMIDLTLTFDARTMDPAYIEAFAKTVGSVIVPLDRRQTLQYDKLVRRALAMYDPELADDVLSDPQAADQRELDDELKNLALIAAGIEPPMPPEGLNFPLRLQAVTRMVQTQPDFLAELSERKKGLLLKRLEYLDFQVQQIKNAETGRVGVEKEG